MPGETKQYANPLIPSSALGELIGKRFGRPTGKIEYYTEASTTPSAVARKNPNRVALMLVNNGASKVYCSFNLSPDSARGFSVDANGGAMSMNLDDDGETVTEDITGIVTTGTSAMTVIETVLEEV